MSGLVILVGAGPGDPDLITLKGAKALASADVVVYDRLVAPELLDFSPPQAERVYVGKEPGRAATPQASINELLVEHARRGATVVRLKGGDPFVFGRGGEELLACAAAGVAVQMVPGVTSAIAAPAAAGIPVTHRDVARSFAVITASTAHGDGTPDLGPVAAAVDTLVLLMAAGRLAEICAALIEAGRPADEPAALVMWATTPEERSVAGTLEDLPALAAAAGLGPPATLVVGGVAAIRARHGTRRGAPSSASTSAPQAVTRPSSAVSTTAPPGRPDAVARLRGNPPPSEPSPRRGLQVDSPGCETATAPPRSRSPSSDASSVFTTTYGTRARRRRSIESRVLPIRRRPPVR